MKNQAFELKNYVTSLVEKKTANFKNSIQDEKIYTICSGKGGVGKSSFVINLALFWKFIGKKVLLFDADLGLANLHIMLGEKPSHHLGSVIRGRKDLSEIIFSTKYHIDLIAGSSGELKLAELSSGEILTLLMELKNLTQYDKIIIDLGAGISDKILTFLRMSQKIILVTTPEPTSIMDGYGMIKVLKQNKIDFSMEVLLNRSLSLKSSLGIFNSLQQTCQKYLETKIDLFGILSRDENLVHSIYRKIPLFNLIKETKYIEELSLYGNRYEKRLTDRYHQLVSDR